ncbi:MAG: S1-like domain-containing RNA-binding protein [Bacteroidia bacterium]|nr:S1-like domain-containing RNA-binding protein [Bacteroidia bacterium]
MIHLGKTNTLTILRSTPPGMFLGDDENEVVLLPHKYVEPEFEIGQKVDVFIYRDSEDRLIATRLKPYAEVNQFAYLNVSEVTKIGAFLDWGLEKDLFVPFKEQKHKMFEGYSYVVYIYIDDVTERIVASSKINKFISNEVLTVKQGDEVDLVVYNETDLGFTCIINGSHKGLIYHNDIFTDLSVGDQVKGYVKLIRENNLIDLSLQNIGFKHVLSSTEKILEYLNTHDGYLDLNDKSSPDLIERRFDMSKSTFKKSIGILYRQRKVTIHDDGVRIVKNNSEGNIK